MPLRELTALSELNDPYRIDTPAFHRNAQWFREQMEAAGLLDRGAHLRGLHYAIVSRGDAVRPDGKPYRNDEESWLFLQDRASKAARWLGYVPFGAIRDARNTEPVIRERPEQRALVPSACAGVLGPDIAGLDLDFAPYVGAQFDLPPQPYRLAIFGEKTSLESVLRLIADRYDADLYLPSGELSDSQIYLMGKAGAEDGRELAVFAFTDCDPAGYQMAVSIGHKLRALKDSQLPALRFRLVAPALTVEQVAELGLPSTPLKASEKFAPMAGAAGMESSKPKSTLWPPCGRMCCARSRKMPSRPITTRRSPAAWRVPGKAGTGKLT